MAVEKSRPEQIVNLITAALRAAIVGTERSYPPDPENVIDDDPWQASDWDGEKGLIYFVYPGANILGEKRTTGTQDENVFVSVLAGQLSSLSREGEMIPVPAPGVKQWEVKLRLAADVKRQLEAALRPDVQPGSIMIPGSVVEDFFYNVNMKISHADWDIVGIDVECRYRRQKGQP